MIKQPFLKKLLILAGAVLLPLAVYADRMSDAVFTLSNATAGNRVLVYSRDGSGRLSEAGSYPTGGFGTGAGLGSQGAVILTEHDRWLLAVNAGSNEISVFEVQHDDLILTDIVSSGGETPVSLTVDKNLVYVVNSGSSVAGNVTGFFLTNKGRLTAIPGSTRPLSGAGVGPAQISFSPSGDTLIVTEKNTNLLDAYQVADNGVAGVPTFFPSPGQTPFGFAFTPAGKLIVSEAWGGAANASTVSSYKLNASGLPVAVTSALALKQGAACWVTVARDGRFAYVSNTGSNSITGLRVATNGSVEFMNNSGVIAQTGNSPADSAVTDNQRFFYVRNSTDGTINQFRVDYNGSLSALATLSGLPAGAAGLVAR